MSLKDLEGSPSLEVVNLVLQKQSRGEKVISLAIGEPAYDTPKEIIDIAYEGMKNGETHYTSSYGTMGFREAAVQKTNKKNGIHSSLENVIFISAKQSIFAVMVSLAGKKDEILVPNPGYFYSEPAILAGMKPIYYNLTENYSLDIDDIHSKIGNRTSAIVINSPANPTGKVMSKEELKSLFEICKDKKIKIVSDEAYEDLIYDKEIFSIGSLEDVPEDIVSIFSLSKSYSMTGWRAGYTVADRGVISDIAKVLEHTFTCYPPFIQKASAYALIHGEKFIEKFKREFKQKRDLVQKRLASIHNLVSNNIEGAFYAFPRYHINMKSVDFSKKLLEKYNVAVLPGTAFGPAGEGKIRISFSSSVDTIEAGLNAVEEFLEENQ
jgi:aspartate/methionine/tyrosine aminotransferase